MSTPPFLRLPESVTALTLSGRGGTLAALRADPARAGWHGPARGDLLLVPGFTGSKEDFIAVLDPLARLGWQVTAYDQRGQYESPGAGTAGCTLDGLADDLLAIAAASPGPVHVVGHSFGGLVARQAALAEGPAGCIASLLLLCSGPGPIKVEDHVALTFVRDQLPGLDLDTLYDLTLAYSGTAERPDEIGRFLRHRYVSNDPVCLAAIAGLLLAAPDRTEELAGLAAAGLAVQVAYGQSDDAWPLHQQDAVAAACGGAAHVITGAGHSPAVDRPEATAALIDELAAAASR